MFCMKAKSSLSNELRGRPSFSLMIISIIDVFKDTAISYMNNQLGLPGKMMIVYRKGREEGVREL